MDLPRRVAVLSFIIWCFPADTAAQSPLETPLRQELLTLLTNEISGQMAFNSLVKLAGAPWVREPAEFTGTFHETQQLYDLVRGYGIETVRLERYDRDGTFSYPTEGELWVVEPRARLVARLGADAALVAGGSRSDDVTGELVYLPGMTPDEISRLGESGMEYTGKVALMWSHPRGEVAAALDALGLRAVISFSARERYLDPNQVVYSSGSYAGGEQLTMGMTVSWRQWSELMEDLEQGRRITVRLHTRVEDYPNRFEGVFAWIPGTEPDAKGVMFTGHLFEGYLKRGANDNNGGPAVQLEILRALHHLIDTEQIPRPRRTIYFLWPNEISGTYEFISRHPGFADKLSINVNMDMVAEGLRKNNSVFTMSETPAHLPSYLDGLTKAFLNYVWRTNDIVYLPDSPRGRPGGQYFPIPMVEKNGSGDAFRFYIHEATGGSDHICFNNPSVAVPGIELFTWPDQWYHADADLPDKADPTEMKRVAFIGAATALTATDLTDQRLALLLEDVSEFGYARVAEGGLPQALGLLDQASAFDLNAVLVRALNQIDAAIARELDAVESIRDIYTGSAAATMAVDNRVAQWELYREGLHQQLLGYARLRAEQLGAGVPHLPPPRTEPRPFENVIPDIHPDVKGTQFYLNRSDGYATHLREHPNAVTDLGLNRNQTTWILNFVNGERSVVEIRNRAAGITGTELTNRQVIGYLEMLEEVGWVVLQE